LALTNVVRVDMYISTMLNNQTYRNYLYIANSPNNNRVVFYSGGHDYTCDWTYIDDGARGHHYRNQEVVQAMLSAGYSVFAYSMPRPAGMGASTGCGDVTDHFNMFSGGPVDPNNNLGNIAMGYFLQPSVEAMNYWDSKPPTDPKAWFADYNWVGLSGGGWTTTIMAALDPRVKVSVPVSGNLPGAYWSANCNKCSGDSEQTWDNFYTIAGYADLMVMGSYGLGRKQLQIMNYQDNCCFGARFYTTNAGVAVPPGGIGNGWGMAMTYGASGNNYAPNGYVQYVGNYTASIQALGSGPAPAVSPMNYSNMIDYGPATGPYPPPAGSAIPNGAVEHQVSAWAQGQILTALAGPSGARAARFSTDLFRR
jgi:hypothetical protein